jgi:hypothetical protein
MRATAASGLGEGLGHRSTAVMTLDDVLVELRLLGASLIVEDGILVYDGPPLAIDDPILAAITEYRPRLLALFAVPLRPTALPPGHRLVPSWVPPLIAPNSHRARAFLTALPREAGGAA